TTTTTTKVCLPATTSGFLEPSLLASPLKGTNRVTSWQVHRYILMSLTVTVEITR
ncbi:hypothetical protein KSS87_006564, partial [Heliosperma pusillum]